MTYNISFVKSIYDLKGLPKPSLPQLVLCGRSNVGKSTFINSLFEKKGIAKTSSTPGKTRSLNFYNVDDVFYVTDLPGYGYAKIGKIEREMWNRIISEYILTTKEIRHAFHIIDIRHNPTELDVQLNKWLKHSGVDYSVILNKSDKLNRSGIAASLRCVKNYFHELELNINLFICSSVKGIGRKEIQKKIKELFY
jgi:GTP-binding protein